MPVLPLVDLDLPSKPPPPLTSFTGFRSRIMASFMSFLTRRQADRTTSMFGICVFMLKPPLQLFRRNVLATSPGESKPKSCLIACVKAARITNRPLPSVRSHPSLTGRGLTEEHCELPVLSTRAREAAQTVSNRCRLCVSAQLAVPMRVALTNSSVR